MTSMHRRLLLAAAGGTLVSGLAVRKLLARDGGARDAGASLLQPVGEALPAELRFTLADGTVRSIADYAGHGVVLNLWATWCTPCVAEMPALDALAGAVAPAGVMVLPLSSDRGGAPAVERFYASRGVRHLPVLLDPSGAAGRALGVRGIPTTVLVDARGMERGRLEGGADWDSAATIAMVKLLGKA